MPSSTRLTSEFARDWFFHNPTRANVGSLGKVPDVPHDAVTSPEYQVWRIREGLIPDFVAILIKMRFFLDLIDCHRVGAVKERLYLANLLEIPIPVLPEDKQQAIVEAWDERQAEIADIHQRVAGLVKQAESEFLHCLGLSKPKRAALSRVFAVQWKDLDRWSVMFNQLACLGDSLALSKFPIVELRECLTSTTNGYCVRPVSRPTAHKMLKLNALQPNGLDIAQVKYIEVSERIARRFHIQKGDLLICRSVGSFGTWPSAPWLKKTDQTSFSLISSSARGSMNGSCLPMRVR